MATKKSVGKSPITRRGQKASLTARHEKSKGRNMSTKNPVARPSEQSELRKVKPKTPFTPHAPGVPGDRE